MILAKRILIVSLLFAPSMLRAQADSGAAVRGLWVSGSAGAAESLSLVRLRDGTLIGELGVDLQRGGWLNSLRYQAIGGFGSFDGRALSLVTGVATTARSLGFASASIGPSAFALRECTGGCGFISDTRRELAPTQWGVGVMIIGDAAFRVGRDGGVGIGPSAFVNWNTARSYAGIVLKLSIGKWR